MRDTKTDRTAELRVTFARVESGRFVEATDTWDFLAFAEQLGVVPPGTMQRVM
jgi:hypothetical protein